MIHADSFIQVEVSDSSVIQCVHKKSEPHLGKEKVIIQSGIMSV